MAKSAKVKRIGSIVCPYCGAESGGSFSTIAERDEAGPTKVVYKCKSCGRFYTAERVISWRVKKS